MREMEHSEAIETHAAERYLLDDMTPEDRDAFEEHFFGCAACAADVRDGARIAAVVRTSAPAVADRRRSSSRAIAAAATVAFAALLGYQNVVTIPRLRAERDAASQPRVIRSVSLLKAASRGGEDNVPAPANEPFSLDFEIPPSPNAQQYKVTIADEARRPLVTRTISRDDARNTVHILIPGGCLPPGRYSLTARAEPPAARAASPLSFVVGR